MLEVGDPVKTIGRHELGVVTAILQPTYITDNDVNEVMVRHYNRGVERLFYDHELLICACAQRNPRKKKQCLT